MEKKTNKKLIKKVASVFAAASIIAIPVQQEVAKALNNITSNEQIFNNDNSQLGAKFLSIRDEFKDSNESLDEQADINALVDEAELNVLNFIETNAATLEDSDKDFIEIYDTDKVFETLFKDEELLNNLYTYTWLNSTFENDLKILIDNYRELKEIQDDMSESNEAGIIADETENEIGGTTDDIQQNPTNDERTELAGNYLFGVSLDLWKDLAIGGALVAVILGASVYGLKKAQKARRVKLSNTDIEYFVGKEHVKEVNLLTSTCQALEVFENEIKNHLTTANVAKNNGDIKKYNKFTSKAQKLQKDSKYLTFKNRKDYLIVRISNLVNEKVGTTNKRLDSILKYAPSARKLVKIPKHENKDLGKYIVNNTERIATYGKIKMRRRYKFLRKFRRFIRRGRRHATHFVFPRLSKKFINFKKNKLTSKVNNSYLLTGTNKLLLNKLRNKGFKEFNREDLINLYNLGDGLSVSDRKIYKKLMNNLYLNAKAEKLDNKDNLKKSNKNIERSNKLLKKIKLLDPSYDLKYFGTRNSINNTPINPVRYICSNNNVVMNYYDRIINTFINKNNKIFELTINYKNNDITESVVCSVDNKDAVRLIKAKILTTLPVQSIEEVEVIEKTIPYVSGKPEILRTNYNLIDEPNSFNDVLTEANKTLLNFEDLFNRYSGNSPLPNNEPPRSRRGLTADEILNEINSGKDQ
ncbi:MAG: hypothetical protein PHS54_04835 [Clostridia bacterium]|nr:hypothetical protein [Clostridia bacterium]